MEFRVCAPSRAQLVISMLPRSKGQHNALVHLKLKASPSARLANIAGGLGSSSDRDNADKNRVPSSDLGLIGLAVM